MNAMEQIFTFGHFICDSLNQTNYDPHPYPYPNPNSNNDMQISKSNPPRLMDRLLQSTPNLLQTCLTIEWKGASHLLSMHQKQIQIIKEEDIFDNQEEDPLE